MSNQNSQNVSDQSRIHLAFVTDEIYSMPTTVAISSLKENCSPENNYTIHIIANEITDFSREKFRECECSNIKIEIYDKSLDKRFFDIYKKDNDLHVSASALLKMQLSDFLEGIEKVLYVDGDILIQQDLKELYDINLEDCYAAVVKDLISVRNINHLRKIGIKNKYYFNSGVMLLNLKKIREDDISNKLIDYRLNGKNHFVDQDAFNVVFGENVKYISLKYNYLNKFHDWMDAENLSAFYQEKIPKSKNKSIKNAVIVHLGTHEKPWRYNMGNLTKLYLKYYEKSPYKEYELIIDEFIDPAIYLDNLIKISKFESLKLRDLIEKLQWHRKQYRILTKEINLLKEKIHVDSAELYEDYIKLEIDLDQINGELSSAKKQLRTIKKSYAYRIGKAIMWFPKKIKKIFFR